MVNANDSCISIFVTASTDICSKKQDVTMISFRIDHVLRTPHVIRRIIDPQDAMLINGVVFKIYTLDVYILH